MPNKITLIVSTIALSMVLSTSAAAASEQSLYSMQHSMNESIIESMNPHAKHERRVSFSAIYEEAASVLNMDKQKLIKELESGKSLADIAKSKNISEEKLRTTLTSKQTAKIDAAVRSGKMTSDKATIMKGKIDEFVGKFINTKGIKHHGRQRLLPTEEKLAKQLGITVEEFRNKLSSGKSITEIAAEKGISKEKLIQSIKEDLTPIIERMINHKHKSE
jgi:DNA-binding phage protein